MVLSWELEGESETCGVCVLEREGIGDISGNCEVVWQVL
jgi:hypothetical protein